jgi:GR25 family glycosyltransferase involved in LPS biosynthesis
MASSFTNRVVDKVYVINLDKDKDRLERVDGQLRANHITYERYPAILGVTVGTNPALSQFCNQFCTDAMKGCALSHTNIWKKMIADGASAVLILEDDALLTDDFDAKLQEVWDQVPADFDIVYLGCGFKCGDSGVVPKLVNKVLGQTPQPVDQNILSVKGSIGFYGYIISNRAARKLQKCPIHTHIDFQMELWIHEYQLNAYSVNPLLIRVNDDGGGSNLSESFPTGLNSVLKQIQVGDQMNLSWALSENSFKLGPFNVNILMLLLFLVVAVLPVPFYKWVFAWIALETLLAKDIGNGVKFAAFLSLPMVAKLLWSWQQRQKSSGR